MANPRDIIDKKRVRKINGSFSWIDHRLISGGFLNDMSSEEILLYFFLVSVSDRHGISFYYDDRICRILKIDLESLGQAREGLIYRSLIVYKYPVYQALSLPFEPVAAPSKEQLEEQKRQKALSYIQKIKQVAKYGRGVKKICSSRL